MLTLSCWSNRAEIQALVNVYTQDYIELQKLKAEAESGGWFSADWDDVAEQQAKLDKDLADIKTKEKEYAEYQKKHGLGIYAHQASPSSTASTQREIKKSGNQIRTTVKNVEDDIRKMQIELISKVLKKRWLKFVMKEKRESKRQKSQVERLQNKLVLSIDCMRRRNLMQNRHITRSSWMH